MRILRRMLVALICFLFFNISFVYGETFSLTELAPIKNVKLRSLKDEYSVSIPIPERWVVNKAIFNFSFVNSSALLAYKSKLVVEVDGIPLKQITLDPLNPEKTVKLFIPGRMLTPGYHELKFIVSQHSEKECEDPFAPELWTILKLAEATLSIDYKLRSIPLKLSSVPIYIEDPKNFPRKHINFVLADLNEDILRIAGIIAGAMGARLKYRPLKLTVSSQILNGVDNLFIGSKKELLKLDPTWHIPKGSCIGINSLPLPASESESNATEQIIPKRDDKHVLLAITGDTKSEIEKAALAFSSESFPFPSNKIATVNEVKMPSFKAYVMKDILLPGISVKFKDLGFKTHVFKGLNLQPVSIDFFLPADLYIKPNQYAVLSLHFSFSGAIRKDSSVKISLNGKPVSSIHLDNEHGAMYENYKILIPTYMFRPGKNKITFQTVLVPLIIRRCEGFHDMNLFLTLFDDSCIRFPNMGHWGKMPALEHFFDSGFPFSKYADGRDSTIFLTSKSYHNVSLALNILSYIGQLTGIIPTKHNIVFDLEKAKGKEIFVIGTIDEIPTSLLELAPLKLLKPDTIIFYPQMEDLTNEKKRSWCEKIEERLRGYTKLFPITPDLKKSKVVEKAVSIDNNTGLIMEFESPFDRGKSIILWTARHKKAFSEISDLLWIGKLRSTAWGDLVLFSLTDQDKVYPVKVGPDYYTGNLTKLDKIDFLLRSYTWLFYLTLGIFVFLLIITLGIYLRRRRKKRLSHEE